MPTGEKKAKAVFAASLLLCIASFFFLGRSEYVIDQFTDWRTYLMFAELLVLSGLLLAAAVGIRKTELRAAALLFISAAFLWIHRAFLPVIAAGGYFLCLIMTGELLLLPGRRKRKKGFLSGVSRFASDFTAGAAAYMVLVCFLSGVHLGGIGLLRKATLLLFAIEILCCLLFRSMGLFPFFPPVLLPESGEAEKASDAGSISARIREVIIPVTILLILLLQAGRLNIAIDYDSVRYALRSSYVLDNGRGIFENLGFVNTVYYYPKGLELLTLPLTVRKTYGFVLAFSFWCGAAVILYLGCLGAEHFGEKKGKRAALLAALIPGITNLMVSAKTDIITLLFQLFAVGAFLRLVGARSAEERTEALLSGGAALFVTLTLKPTAPYFSGVLFLAAVGFLCFGMKKEERSFAAEGIIPGAVEILVSAVAFAGVTLRTIHLTGLPFINFLAGLWVKLGMEDHYPLMALALPNSTGSGDVSSLWERFFWMFISPDTEEALHILIAWGGPVFTVLVVLFLAELHHRKKQKKGKTEEKKPEALKLEALITLLAALILFDLAVLLLLSQVDGNYFNLTYALIALAVPAMAGSRMQVLLRGMIPALFSAVILTGTTNWAGVHGFTEPRLLHYGFYDHEHNTENYMILHAKDPFYRYLYNAPRMRVLAIGDDPDCYYFPCRTESYTDFAGSGGNVALVKTLNDFKNCLEYTGITCIYTETPYLNAHPRAEEMVRYMVEDGSLTEIITQEGNTLYEYHAGIRD